MRQSTVIVIKKSVIYAICTIIISIVLTVSYLFIQANKNNHRIILNAPHGQVTIERDQYDVPHIVSKKNDDDVFFALGYIHAKDRLWQMEFQRRVVTGTLSELFGNTTLTQDKYLRTWGFYIAAKQSWAALDDQTKKIVHAYTQGINHYLATQSLPLPFILLNFKPKPWDDIDAIAWQKMMAWNLETSWDRKIKNALLVNHLNADKIDVFYPPYPSSSPTILSNRDLAITQLTRDTIFHKQPITGVDKNANTWVKQTSDYQTIRRELGFTDDHGKGSNAWVVSGKFTRTGKPILANDVHLPLTSPSLFYLVELKGPTLHVTGATIAGTPLVAIGHNDHIAWGVTHSYVDTQDLYIENDSTKFEERSEIINIKGSKPLTLIVKVSKHGPIISRVSSAGKVSALVAIKWPALFANDTTITSFTKLNYARNWNEFVAALNYYVTPPQNFLYADVEGNIGYYLPGKIPVRSGWDGRLPVSPNHPLEWAGYIPFEQLPHSYNPPEGFITAANNKIVSNTYPYPLSFRWNVPPFRIQRILSEINAKPVDMEATKQLQNDVISNIWLLLRPQLLATIPFNENSKNALEILKQWNGSFDINSVGASIFAYWYQAMLQPSSEYDQPLTFDPLFIVQALKSNQCYLNFTTSIRCDQFLTNTLEKAMIKLRNEHGNDASKWTWGMIHKVKFQAFAIGKSRMLGWIWNREAPAPGGDYTVNVGTYDPITMTQTIGAAYRQIIDLSNFNNSLYVIPLGEIDNPFSLHYNNQMPRWLKGGYIHI